MDALEIEEAISKLATQSFDACEFPFAFLKAFGNKETTIKKLRSIKHTFNSLDIKGDRNRIILIKRKYMESE